MIFTRPFRRSGFLMLTISDKCAKILMGSLILQQFYVDGKLIRQTGGFGTIDFIYGASGVIVRPRNRKIYFAG